MCADFLVVVEPNENTHRRRRLLLICLASRKGSTRSRGSNNNIISNSRRQQRAIVLGHFPFSNSHATQVDVANCRRNSILIFRKSILVARE